MYSFIIYCHHLWRVFDDLTGATLKSTLASLVTTGSEGGIVVGENHIVNKITKNPVIHIAASRIICSNQICHVFYLLRKYIQICAKFDCV